MASLNGHTEIMMLLLENKCDANVTDKRGDTPLILAAYHNKMTIARELAWSLGDLKIPNKEGKTAAERANYGRGGPIAEYLANEAPREQVRLASCAYDAITYSSTRLFSAWL